MAPSEVAKTYLHLEAEVDQEIPFNNVAVGGMLFACAMSMLKLPQHVVEMERFQAKTSEKQAEILINTMAKIAKNEDVLNDLSKHEEHILFSLIRQSLRGVLAKQPSPSLAYKSTLASRSR